MVFLDLTYGLSINTLGETKDHSCNTKMDYNYDSILYNTAANKNERSLNCSVPFHPLTFSEVTGKAIDICNNHKLGEKAYSNYNNIQRYYHVTPKHKPCMWMDVEFLGVPLFDLNQQENEGFVRLYFKSRFRVKTMILYYSFSSLAADLAGYIGMFLGISLVDLAFKFSNLVFKIITA